MLYLLMITTIKALFAEGYQTVDTGKNSLFVTGDSVKEDNVRDIDTPRDNGETIWYLMELSGNPNLVHQNYESFILYLKLNTASFAGTEYDKVIVNSVSYTPSLLVNMTISGNNLSDTLWPFYYHSPYNVSELYPFDAEEKSLINLFASSFNVTSLTRSSELFITKPVPISSYEAQEREKYLLYFGIGAIVILILSTGLLFCMLLFFIKRRKPSSMKEHELLAIQNLSVSSSGRFQDPTQIIYSEHIKNGGEDDSDRKIVKKYSGILDDNLCPIKSEIEFTPRYIQEEDTKSFVSDISIGECRPLDSPLMRNTLLDESIDEPDRVSELSRSPFYNIPYSSSPRPQSGASIISQKTNKRSVSTISNGKKPPRPPSRSDSLDPRARVSLPNNSTEAKLRKISASRGSHQRPFSVPAPRPGSSTPQSSRPASSASHHGTGLVFMSPLDEDIIEHDVSSILQSLDIE